jgi:nicotinamide mononucleotide transporter
MDAMNVQLTMELTGALLALLYLWLEIRQRNAMWIVSIVSSAFYVVIFYHGKFYADMGLNAYYILAGIYGLWCWKYRRRAARDERRPPCAAHTPPHTAVVLALVALGLFGLVFYLLKTHTDSPVPFGDALTTALSIVAMWMLAHKFIEQWGVWFVVNVISMALYFWRGLYPTAILFALYAIASVIGYGVWLRQMNDE